MNRKRARPPLNQGPTETIMGTQHEPAKAEDLAWHSPRQDGLTAPSRREVLRLVSLAVGMIATWPLLAACTQSAVTPAPTPAGSSPVAASAISNTPTFVPATNTPELTEVPPTPTTAPVTATTLPSPTPADTATAVPSTNTPKAEASPTSAAKPVLANYAVYSDNKTLLIADLPPDKDHPTAPHEVFVYWALDGYGPTLLTQIRTGDTTFRTGNIEDGGDHGWVLIKNAEIDNKTGILSGEIKIGSNIFSYKLGKIGTGLPAILHSSEAIKTIAQQLGTGGHIPDATMLKQINDQLIESTTPRFRSTIVYLHP